jgi:hypothetical protein
MVQLAARWCARRSDKRIVTNRPPGGEDRQHLPGRDRDVFPESNEHLPCRIQRGIGRLS